MFICVYPDGHRGDRKNINLKWNSCLKTTSWSKTLNNRDGRKLCSEYLMQSDRFESGEGCCAGSCVCDLQEILSIPHCIYPVLTCHRLLRYPFPASGGFTQLLGRAWAGLPLAAAPLATPKNLTPHFQERILVRTCFEHLFREPQQVLVVPPRWS